MLGSLGDMQNTGNEEALHTSSPVEKPLHEKALVPKEEKEEKEAAAAQNNLPRSSQENVTDTTNDDGGGGGGGNAGNESNENDGENDQNPPPPPPTTTTTKDPRFYAIIASLSIVSLMSAAENTVLTTALPTIVSELRMGDTYIWTNNAFFLTSSATQPILGQLSTLFGRRRLFLFVLAVFIVGSAICGASPSGPILILGRAVQGLGSGGIAMLSDVVISDLVPLRDRGTYLALLLTVYGIGLSLGPFLGGLIVERTTWRWVFLLNLPLGVVAFGVLYLALRVRWPGKGKGRNGDKTSSWWARLGRVDWGGSLLIMAATVAVLVPLTWAGVKYPWTSWRVLVPLLLGLFGLVVLVPLYEMHVPALLSTTLHSGDSKSESESYDILVEPVVPPRLFRTRTQIIVYANTLLNSAVMYWVYFFVPVYFQSVRLSTPSQSGLQTLVLCLVGVPGAVASMLALSRWGRYKPLQIAGFALFTLGAGLLGTMGQPQVTSGVAWGCICAVPALGSGVLSNTLLPAFQASAEESDQAAATASWSFARSFGNIFGGAIPAAIFNAYTAYYATSLPVMDVRARDVLSSGESYAFATRSFILSFDDETTQNQLVTVYSWALHRVFWIAIAPAGLGLVMSLVEEEVGMRTDLETDFGLERVASRRTRKQSGGLFRSPRNEGSDDA